MRITYSAIFINLILFFMFNTVTASEIHDAAASGNLSRIRHLVERGAIHDEHNEEGLTPSQVAEKNGKSRTSEFLNSIKRKKYPSGSSYTGQIKHEREHGWGVYWCFNGSRYSGEFKNGNFHGLGFWYYANGSKYAGQFRNNSFFGKNVKFHDKDVFAKDRYGETLLYRAAKRGSLTQVRLLIRKGAGVNEMSKRDQTPLHFAAFEGRDEIARLLIDVGAKVNIKDVDGMTPLHFAADNNQLEMTKILLKNGALINAKNENGSTALHHAVYHDNAELAQLLIEKGAGVSIRDRSGKTPLDHARILKSKNVMKILKKK